MWATGRAADRGCQRGPGLPPAKRAKRARCILRLRAGELRYAASSTAGRTNRQERTGCLSDGAR
jgi:hypothetical protein